MGLVRDARASVGPAGKKLRWRLAFQDTIDIFRGGQKSAQKRPIGRRIGIARFAETGWWSHQGSNLGPDD